MTTIFFGGNGFVGKNCNLLAIRPKSKDCDLANYESTFNYLKTYQGKQVNIVNAAAFVAGFQFNKGRNVEMLYENSLIALNLMRAIKELDISGYYLYVSSVCGYKDGNDTEDLIFNDEPCENNYGYGMSKRLGIASTRSLEIDLKGKVKCCNLIPSNMMGWFDDFSDETSHFVPAIIKKMLRGDKQITVLGNANNLRDFLYVADLGKVIEQCVNKQITGTYNVSSGVQTSISDAVDTIKDVFGYNGEIIKSFGPNPEKRKVNNSKLKSVIEFNPTSFVDGLKLTKEWLESDPPRL